MKSILTAFFFSLVSGLAPAQNVSYEAVRVADMLTDSGWQNLEQTLPALISAMEARLRVDGATEKAARVFGAEVKKSMNRDAVAKAMAVAITKRMSSEEVKELAAFLQSGAGSKYLQMQKDILADASLVAPMLRQACEASARQLNDVERGTISATCSKF